MIDLDLIVKNVSEALEIMTYEEREEYLNKIGFEFIAPVKIKEMKSDNKDN